MADKKETKKDNKQNAIANQIGTTHQDEYTRDIDAHDDYISNFDAWEAMVVSETYDSVTRQTSSKITDGAATTLLLERSSRVVGQLPTGVTKAAGKKDKGKALLMDIVRQKYIYPNANAQMPFLDKLRSWEFYSSVYGFMPMYYDWNVSSDGYIGPDCWLWNPRNFIPESGKATIHDMNYCHAIVYQSPSYLDDVLDEPESAGWDKEAVRSLKDVIKEQKDSREADTKRDSFIRQRRQNGPVDEIELVTRYEAGEDGEWVTFVPEHGYMELRRIKNPHKNGKIPFVIKPAIPLYDSFYNLSDMQRFRPIQAAKDGLTNFYFEGIKTNLNPQIVINANGVIRHTISQEAGAVLQETIPNSIRRLETSTAGLATYQAASSQLQGMLLNNAGTTDTAVNADSSLDPGFGKTPEALKLLSQRENTRDNQNRALLETALEQLMDGMLGLITTVGTENIPIDLFEEEIEMIRESGYTDIEEMISLNESGATGKLTIKAKDLKGLSYKFFIDTNSTTKTSKQEQKQSYVELLEFMKAMPNALESLQQEGKTINWEYVFNQFGQMSDIENLDQIITQMPGPTPQEQELEAQLQEAMQMIQQLQAEQQAQQQVQQETPQQVPGAGTAGVLDPTIASQIQALQQI